MTTAVQPTPTPRPNPAGTGPGEGECTARYHGTASAYTKHCCRCPAARAATTRLRKIERSTTMRRPTAFVPYIGTIRRLRALGCLGHGDADLAAMLGWSVKVVHDTRGGWRPGRIRRDRAAAVAAIYTRLRMVPGRDPETRALATARGWVPPAAWDGQVFAIDDPTACDDLAAATLGWTPAQRRLIAAEHRAAKERTARTAAAARDNLSRARAHRHPPLAVCGEDP